MWIEYCVLLVLTTTEKITHKYGICVCMRWFINSITKRYFTYLYAVKIAINNTTK